MAVEDVDDLLLHLEVGVRLRVLELRAEHLHQVVVVVAVEARLREVQVNQLEHRLDVLGRARGVHRAGVFAHRRLYGGRFARELLAEFRGGELAHARHRTYGGHHLAHVVLGVRQDRQTAFRLRVHTYLVGLELRGLHDDLRAVGERPHRRAVLLVLHGLLHGRTLQLGPFGDQRLLHHVVLVGFDFRGGHLLADGENLLLGRVRNALLLGSRDDDHLVRRLDGLLGEGVHRLDVQHLDEHAVELPFGLGVRHRFVLAVVLQIDVHELLVGAVVAVGVGAFHLAHQVLLRPLELALRESVAADLLHLGIEGLEAFGQLAVLRHGGEGRGVERRDDADDIARAHAGAEERCVGLHGDLLQAGVLHGRQEGFDHIDHFPGHLVVHLRRYGRALDEELHARTLHFGVGVDADDRLLVVGHDDHLLLGGVGRRGGNVGHQRLEPGFRGLGVQIADDDDRLVVGAVPFLVEALQRVVLEALQPVEVTDQVAVLVARALAQSLQQLHRRTPRSAVARAQLLHDDAALGVDLLGPERDEVRPVVQDQHGRVDDSLARGRDVRNVVNRLVPARTGVEVVAEFHADGLQVLDELFSGEVLRAVEGHVFEEVGQTLLVVLLLDGAHVVQDVEVGLPLGLFVVPDVVGQSVVEPARADLLVRRYRLHRIELCHCAACGEHRCGQHQ